MKWSPITKDELESIIDKELACWPIDLVEGFKKIRVPRKISCKRSDQHGTEDIFVIAEYENSFIVYDDVEDDFGVAQESLIRDGVLTGHVLFADLIAAYREMIKEARLG